MTHEDIPVIVDKCVKFVYRLVRSFEETSFGLAKNLIFPDII